MKFVNRGYMVVQPTKSFIEWANKNDEDYSDLTSNESSVYLIEEDFYDDEPVVKANFKQIFLNELMAVSEDEEVYPEITLENFNAYFSYQLGSTVFDAEASNLVAD